LDSFHIPIIFLRLKNLNFLVGVWQPIKYLLNQSAGVAWVIKSAQKRNKEQRNSAIATTRPLRPNLS
jgi:hypothetical protein